MSSSFACRLSGAEEEAAREDARRLEAENPLWLVVFGVYSRAVRRLPPVHRAGWRDPDRAVSNGAAVTHAEDRELRAECSDCQNGERLKLAADVIIGVAGQYGEIISGSWNQGW